MSFTNDEMNLLCIYNGGGRKESIAELTAMREYLMPEETELRELTDSVLGKLGKMSDAEFDSLDLFPDFDE